MHPKNSIFSLQNNPLDRMQASFLHLPTEIKRLWIAFSGGLDSYVLLHATHQLRPHDSLTAIHINHGLYAQAIQWEKHAQSICKALAIPLVVHRVASELAQYKKAGHSPEEAARKARYAALTRALNNEDCLLTGHQLEDQAETLILNLMRGAGIQGLGGMPLLTQRDSTYHLRPLLNWTYRERLAYATQHKLRWIEDLSNQDEHFSRNFVRHTVLPALNQGWREPTQQLARTAAHCLEASQLTQELAIQDLGSCEINSDQLSIAGLLSLSLLRRRNTLRYWLKRQLGKPVSTEQFHRIAQLLNAPPKTNPCFVLKSVTIQRYQGHLYLLNNQMLKQDASNTLWNPKKLLKLLHYTLTAKLSKGQGIRATLLLEQPLLMVRWRQGGERFHPKNRIGSRPLKKLFQEWGILPWERHRWPLIYHNNTLVAIPGYAVSEQSAAGPHEWGLVINIANSTHFDRSTKFNNP